MKIVNISYEISLDFGKILKLKSHNQKSKLFVFKMADVRHIVNVVFGHKLVSDCPIFGKICMLRRKPTIIMDKCHKYQALTILADDSHPEYRYIAIIQ